VSDHDRKLSWKEIDQRRDGTRRDEPKRPRDKFAQERADQATKEYMKELDKLFSTGHGGAEGEEQVKALRAAHGTPELAKVCRTFQAELGLPKDVGLLSIFLDSNEPELVVEALEVLLALQKSGDAEFGKGVVSQLRVLAQDFNNDIAEIAEEIVEELE
jgi:hypothetical protein